MQIIHANSSYLRKRVSMSEMSEFPSSERTGTAQCPLLTCESFSLKQGLEDTGDVCGTLKSTLHGQSLYGTEHDITLEVRQPRSHSFFPAS